MKPASSHIDRSALVRRAMVELVAENGFSGTSMSAVAARAGVATGTAYVHYESKDALVVAAFREIKSALGKAAVAELNQTSAPEQRFQQLWQGIYRHLAADPAVARFLIQFESLPIAATAHAEYVAEEEDALIQSALAPDLASLLIDLPVKVLFDLGVGPAIRLAASDIAIDDDVLDRTAKACWRAITTG